MFVFVCIPVITSACDITDSALHWAIVFWGYRQTLLRHPPSPTFNKKIPYDHCQIQNKFLPNSTSLSANLFRLVETDVANCRQLHVYSCGFNTHRATPTQLNSPVESRRRRRCVLGINDNAPNPRFTLLYLLTYLRTYLLFNITF